MTTRTVGLFLRHLALSEEIRRLENVSDQALLAAYESERGQAAFAELMCRHGPMVLHTCRRVLGRGPDAEDAFQATFVILARKAGSISKRKALGGWLHRVAYRTALNVLTGKIRRRTLERQISARTHSDPDPSAEATWNEVRPILDAELDALPQQARQLLVACYLQGKTHVEAAAELGLPPGSLARRLERARALLATRLARRGVTLSAGLLATLLGDLTSGAEVPAVLLVQSLNVAMTFNEPTSGAVSVHVAHLVKLTLANMTQSSITFSIVLACCLGLVGMGVATYQLLDSPSDEPGEAGPAATQVLGQPEQEGKTAARVDCYGDPLPPHALARMGTVRLWQGGDRGSPKALAFSPDGKTLAGRIDAITVCLWDVATGKEIRRLTTKAIRGHVVGCLGFSRDGKTLITTDIDQTVWWEVATGKFFRKQEYQGPKRDNIKSSTVAYLPDGKILGFGDFLKSVDGGRGAYVRDAVTGKEICQLNEQRKRRKDSFITSAFSPDGKLLATVNWPFADFGSITPRDSPSFSGFSPSPLTLPDRRNWGQLSHSKWHAALPEAYDATTIHCPTRP